MSENGSDADPQEQAPSIGTYVGDRAATGERHGKGTNTFPNGDVYEGEYEAGLRHGRGMYTWKKPKARYLGEYSRNLRHGEGMFAYPDGSRYKGQFKEGKRNGNGIYVYSNGDSYEGLWENNVKHGHGVYTFAINKTKITGNWEAGWLSGPARIYRVDHKVEGEYELVKENKPVDPDDPNLGTIETIVDTKLRLPCSIEFQSSGYQIHCNLPEQVGIGASPIVKDEA